MKIFVIAKYHSKYGTILYAAKVTGAPEAFELDMENVYINTLYLKSKTEVKINEFYDVETIKGENGLTYCII